MYESTLSYGDLRISPLDIYEQMGYGRNAPDDDTRYEMEQVAEHVRRMLRPRFCFVMAEGVLDERRNTLTTVGAYPCGCSQTLNIGHIITRQLRGSEAYAFFVCTSGTEFEMLQCLFKQSSDMVKTFIADAMGSVIAEKTADCMEEHLEGVTGTNHTNRFSPGYCGWHVSEQQKLFSLFPVKNPCGVRLTDSSLMLPIKSVSGVIGIGRSVRKQEYSCGLCDYVKCYKRRKKPAL